MSTTATIILADRFIPIFSEGGVESAVEKIASGRYVFSDADTDPMLVVMAADVVAGVLAWAAETLDDMASDQASVAVASAVHASRFDDGIALSMQLDDQVRLGIQDRVKHCASRSGKLATLHRPAAATESAVTV